ncbi:MAG: histidine kinase [Saprospiraceae bacterium]|nr:histidine kinase [Saprospiraceae bacterium]
MLKLQNGEFIGGINSPLIFNKNLELVSNKTSKNIITQIFCLSQDNFETIWIGTLTGLYKIKDYNYEDVSKITDRGLLLNTRINHIVIFDDQGAFLATHGNGLLFNSIDQNHTHNLTTQDGLSSDLINRIYLENDSTLWLATNNGLDKLTFEITDSEIKAKEIQSITTADGLHSNYIYDVIKWRDEIWVATQSGVNYFKPEDVTVPDYTPPIYFDSIRASGKNILSESMINLDHDENDLNFHYTGVSYRKPTNKEFYKYALIKDKQDTSWVYTNDRSIQFTNLERGNYHFIVMARNKYNKWSEKPAEFGFTVLPSFFQTLWFKLIVGFSLLLTFLTVYRSRIKRLERKEEFRREIDEAEFRVKKAELNALRNQMNPHFIYNSLNSIQNFIFHNRPERANFFLSKFSRLMRTSLDMSKLNLVEIGEEIRFLEDYLALEELRFENKFESTISVSEDIDQEMQIPPLMIQPLLENAIKHGFKNLKKGGLLDLNISIKDNTLSIIIQDNGSGIPATAEGNDRIENRKSFSTNIIKDRLKVINSTLKFPVADLKINHKKTKFNKGTYVELVLPLNK